MMHPREQAFLVLCDELNFTRAADRCFMTQQGLSAHIKKLEEQYGTRLFLRTPKVELTENGKALRLALLRKASVEEDLLRTIRETDSGSIGRIHFGINSARAALLAPDILDSFCPAYERVEVHFTTGDTETLVRNLREGRIDGLLGVNAVPERGLAVEHLLREEIFLITRTGAKAGKDIGEVSIRKLAAPEGPVFVRNAEGSTLNAMIDRMLQTHNVCLKSQALISDYNVQLSLCKTLGFAVFCPESLVFAGNGPAGDPHLRVYRIREMKERMTISLVTDADRNYPACATAFFRAVKSVFKGRSRPPRR